MKTFIDKFSSLVKGAFSGFDRIVFKGCILPLMAASEVMSFCRSRGILNIDYKRWMMTQTAKLINNADKYAKDNSGQGIINIPT